MPESICTSCRAHLVALTDEELMKLELQHHRDSVEKGYIGDEEFELHSCGVFKVFDEGGVRERFTRAYAHGRFRQIL